MLQVDLRRSNSKVGSCVSGKMGSLCGNLMSPLSAQNAIHVRGPAFSHALLRAGITQPNMLRGPRCGKPRSLAMQLQTSKGVSVMYSSSGKSALQTLLVPFGRQEDKTRRSPVSAFTSG